MDCYKTQASALLDLWEDFFVETLKYPFIFTHPLHPLPLSEFAFPEAILTPQNGTL